MRLSDLTDEQLAAKRAAMAALNLARPRKTRSDKGTPRCTETCKSGKHPWVEKNIYRNPKTGSKSCKLCRRAAWQRWYADPDNHREHNLYQSRNRRRRRHAAKKQAEFNALRESTD